MQATYTQFIQIYICSVCVYIILQFGLNCTIRFMVWKTLQYTHIHMYAYMHQGTDGTQMHFVLKFCAFFCCAFYASPPSLPLFLILMLYIETNCKHSNVKWNQYAPLILWCIILLLHQPIARSCGCCFCYYGVHVFNTALHIVCVTLFFLLYKKDGKRGR